MKILGEKAERVLRRFATKSDAEREDEETERLVRDAPKIKPPRRDKRREQVETEQDPDLKNPSNAENDPDLSSNYKTIGGSYKMAESNLINVKLKEDPSRVVQVTKETLQTQPDKYEEIKDSEEEPKEEGEAPNKAQALEKAHTSLQEMAQTDQEFSSILKDFTDPASDIFQFAKARPDTPVDKFLRGRTPPKGINTLGDLRKVLLYQPPASSGPEAPSKEPAKGAPPSKEKAPKAPPEAAGTPLPKEPPAPQKPEGYPERSYTKNELENARLQIVRTFPTQIAADILLLQPPLHPDEVTSLVLDYHAARSLPAKDNDVEGIKEAASKFYTTNPNSVPPPKTVDKEGEEVEFSSLPGEEQAKALRQHQIQTVAMSLAARDMVRGRLEKSGAPKDLAETLSGFLMSGKNEAPAARQKRASQEAEALFYKGLEKKPVKIADSKVSKVLESMKDPAAKKLAVGYFQAQDYNEARAQFLDPTSKTHISERQSPRAAANNLSKAMDFLRKRAERYPKGTSEDIASTFKTRVMRHLSALAPDKFPKLQEFMDEADHRHYDQMMKGYKKERRAFDKAKKQAEQEFSKDYKAYSAKLKEGDSELDPPLSSQDRLAKQGIEEPREPAKPPRYDLQRKDSGELEQTASDMWEKFRGRTASAQKVVARAKFHSFSTYPDTSAMGKNRQAVYWGVEPESVQAYPGWSQHQSRDVGESDFKNILTAARGWLSTPMLSGPIEGIVEDTRFRAALDLAIQTEGYRNALHQVDYNNLLARLAGKPQDETLLTIREAASSGYNEDAEIAYRIPGKGDFKRKRFKTEEEAIKWIDRLEEKEGKVDIRWVKWATKESEMPKNSNVEMEKTVADRLLGRLDRIASEVQEKHESWGMSFEAAKSMVNEIDKIADELELATYGQDSMITRQAQVLQRESDEPYMETFQNPMQPRQVEADEPYMQAYRDDQSSAVHSGKSETGRPLAP